MSPLHACADPDGRQSATAPATAIACLLIAAVATAASADDRIAVRVPQPVSTLRKTISCAIKDELAFGQTERDEQFGQLQQSVTALAGGGFGTVWMEDTVGHRAVRMQWLDNQAHFVFPLGGRFITASTSDHFNPVIVAAAAGGAYVAFEFAYHAVVVQYFDALGQPRWPGEGIPVVDDDPTQWTARPFLISNPAGGVFACFEFWNPAGNDIRCQRFDDSGTRLWSAVGRSASGGGSLSDLRVLPRGLGDGSGGILLFWRNQRDPFTPTLEPMLMEGQRLSGDGIPLWGASPKVVRTTNLAPSNSYTFFMHQVVTDGSGGAVLAFNDWTRTSDFHLDVMAQRVSGAGELLWGDGAVVTGANGHQQHDQTIATADGGAFVVVFESVSETHNRLLLFRLGADGTHVWSEAGVEVSDPGSSALDYGSFGFHDGDALRLAWTHQNIPASFEMDVVLKTYASDGTLTDTTFLTKAQDGQFLEGIAWSAEFGGLLAVWDDRRKGTWDDLDTGGALLKQPAACRTGFFHTVTPCRLVDTREGSALTPSQEADFTIFGKCGVPNSAAAVALNLTVVSPTGQGHLIAYPVGSFRPPTSVLNFRSAQTRANSAVIPLPLGGAFGVLPVVADGGSTHLVIDVSGYFE
jgi:hypothetical protein